MNIDRNTAMLRAAKLEEIEQEIRARTPRASARLHVSLSNPPIRTVYQTQMRVSGKRDDVLDFTAALYDEVKGMVRPDGSLPSRCRRSRARAPSICSSSSCGISTRGERADSTVAGASPAFRHRASRARQRSASSSASLNGFVRPFVFARTRAMSATVTGVARFPQLVRM